jgi:hypothetical protein
MGYDSTLTALFNHTSKVQSASQKAMYAAEKAERAARDAKEEALKAVQENDTLREKLGELLNSGATVNELDKVDMPDEVACVDWSNDPHDEEHGAAKVHCGSRFEDEQHLVEILLWIPMQAARITFTRPQAKLLAAMLIRAAEE